MTTPLSTITRMDEASLILKNTGSLYSDIFNQKNIGLGTYLFINIPKKFPISFFFLTQNNLITNNSFKGNNKNVYLRNGVPISFNYQGKNYYFYFGNVSITIKERNGFSGYLYYNEDTQIMHFFSTNVIFDENNKNGIDIDDYLNYYENQKLVNFNFYFKNNYNSIENISQTIDKLKITGYDKKKKDNQDINPNFNVYLDYNDFDFLKIRSNCIPNYHILKNNSLISGQWLNTLGLLNDTNSYNYGIDKNKYGFIEDLNLILGTPFKIPINPESSKNKYIPDSIIGEDEIKQKVEIFWYNDNRNWKEIMVERNQSNLTLNNNTNEVLTPLGPIGVMINGIPCYNHLENYQPTVTKNTNDLNSISDSRINRIHVNTEIRTEHINQVPIKNYDDFGGTVDLNHTYHYNKYPVGLSLIHI